MSAFKHLAVAIAELDRRAREPLAVYRPTPAQEAFHKSHARYRIVVGGNRAGKTLCAAIEFASVFTGMPVLDCQGQPIPWKFGWKPEGLTLWSIAFDQKYIAQTIHRMLFEPGVFLLLKQPDGTYVTFNPEIPEHKAREDECIKSEPLIPERFIQGGYGEGLKYEDLGKRVINEAHGVNGTRAFFFPSTSRDAKGGDDVHLLWPDEDIMYPDHVPEWRHRLKRVKGWFQWSATPQMKHTELLELCKKAEEDEGSENPDFAHFRLRARDNPTIATSEHNLASRGLSEDIIRAREEGEFTFDSTMVYPAFSPYVHGVPSREGRTDLLNSHWQDFHNLPFDWTRYLVLDPGGGEGITAVAFFAVPPPHWARGHDDFVVLEDEIYVKRHTADQLAVAVKQKMAGRIYEAFIMDAHAGRQTPHGHGHTTKMQYTMAFERHKIVSRQTGSSFLDGSDNTSAREMTLRTWLNPKQEVAGIGYRPRLRYVPDRVIHFVKEIQNLRVRPTGKRMGHDHLIDCVEYAAAHGLPYVEVPRHERKESPLEMRDRIFGLKKSAQGMQFGPSSAFSGAL